MKPPVIDITKIHRILIIKLSALGDILHALPVSAALGKAYPNIEIGWVCEEMFEPLLQGNTYLTRIHTLPKLRPGRLRESAYRRGYSGKLMEIRRQHYDLTLDLQGLTKSAVVAAASGAKFRLGYHWIREAALLVESPIPQRPESVHIVEQYLDVARYLGADSSEVEFPFHIPDEDDSAVSSLLAEGRIQPGQPCISVNPAAGHPLKQWGTERYAALIEKVWEDQKLPAILLTADKAVGQETAALVRTPLANLTGKTSMKMLAAAIRQSAVHICGDTGSGHLAAALKRPVVALVGPTDPDRACPYGQRQNTLCHRELCSGSCTWHHCAYPHPRCLDSITVDEVAEKIGQLIGTGEQHVRSV